MVKETLVDRDISDGKILIKMLEKSGFKVRSAFWLYVSELGEWSLFLASDYVDKYGQKKAYEFIQNELSKASSPISIYLSNINAVKVNDDMVNLLKVLIKTGPNDLNEMRFTQNVINGVMIEDAFIYRIT